LTIKNENRSSYGGRMKLSRYNHFIDWENKLHLIFNARSAALLKLNRKTFLLLRDSKDKEIDTIVGQLAPEVLKLLKENEIIIPNNTNEILQIKIDTTMKRFANNSLSITIAPTSDCNFSCRYCYEKHGAIYMDQSIQQKVLDFIEWYLRDIKYLDVVWYGGEPLLAKDVVFYLTKEIQSLSDKYNVKSKFSMITKGYLLTKDVANHMHTLGIDGVQVTIDGPQDIHDVRRPLKDGTGTFDTIINNLKACEALIPNLTVRINVDRHNLTHLSRLKEILYNQEGISRFATLAYSPVDALSESNKKYEPYCLSMREFSEVDLEFLIEEFKGGNYDISAPPMGSGCGAIASNSWVIGPDGYMYKCWCDIGYKEKSVGHLSDPEKLNSNYYDWLSFDILKFAECKECDILPLCMGACPDRLKKLEPKIFCTRWKFYLREMLILYYISKMKGEKGGRKHGH
jgi:uncharacterized protein